MLHGVLIYPGDPDEAFAASLQTIKGLRWESIIPTLNGTNYGNYNLLLTSHCNLVAILDPNFTKFGYLSGLVRNGCHLFLPEMQEMTSNERMKLIQLAEEGNTFIQIRNDLLYHPSFPKYANNHAESKLIEIHHFAPGRHGKIQEMLYSNLLMIMKIIDSDPSRISVCSIPNSVYRSDVVNLHLNFHNGSAASLTLAFTGKRKEHLLSVHSASGIMTYNFKENNPMAPLLKTGQDQGNSFRNELLLSQISDFADCITKKCYQPSGLSAETKTLHLVEKINQKLELSPVTI